jgi:ribonuclease HI
VTKDVTIFTDGSCLGNPGKGGWAAILTCNGKSVNIYGYSEHTTNNAMEITAAIEGLKKLKEQCEVKIFTDSKYVQQGITQWAANWQRNNWRTADKKPVKNVELWQSLVQLCNYHTVSWEWVKAHADNAMNNMVDELAQNAARQQIASA